MKKHSREPWTMEEARAGASRFVVKSRDGELNVEVTGDDLETTEANALLITASPNLLKEAEFAQAQVGRAQKLLRAAGVKFDGEGGTWEDVAYGLYTLLCETHKHFEDPIQKTEGGPEAAGRPSQ